jgi:hypothetical protein
MDFEIPPLPVETEFRVHSIKERLHQLTREELEELLVESLSTLTQLTHQTKFLKGYILNLQGKISQD